MNEMNVETKELNEREMEKSSVAFFDRLALSA